VRAAERFARTGSVVAPGRDEFAQLAGKQQSTEGRAGGLDHDPSTSGFDVLAVAAQRFEIVPVRGRQFVKTERDQIEC